MPSVKLPATEDLRHYGILSPVFGLFEQLPGAVEAALLHEILDLGFHAFVVDAAGLLGSIAEQILLLGLSGLLVDLGKRLAGGGVMYKLIQVLFGESARPAYFQQFLVHAILCLAIIGRANRDHANLAGFAAWVGVALTL